MRRTFRYPLLALQWGCPPRGADGYQVVLDQVVTAPFDYQRILVHAWGARGRILSSDALRGRRRDAIERFLRERQVGYVVVFSDFTPEAEHERVLVALAVEGRVPQRELRNGWKGASVYQAASGWGAGPARGRP